MNVADNFRHMQEWQLRAFLKNTQQLIQKLEQESRIENAARLRKTINALKEEFARRGIEL